MNDELTHHPLAIALDAAVPLHIALLHARGGPDEDDWGWARAQGSVLSGPGAEGLLHRSPVKGETARFFNVAAQAIAVAAFVPGGIRFAGRHWRAGPANSPPITPEDPMTPTAPDALDARRELAQRLACLYQQEQDARRDLIDQRAALERLSADRLRVERDLAALLAPAPDGVASNGAAPDGPIDMAEAPSAGPPPAPTPKARRRKKADPPAPGAEDMGRAGGTAPDPTLPPPARSLVLGVDVEGVDADALSRAYFVGHLAAQRDPAAPVPVRGVLLSYRCSPDVVCEETYACTGIGSDATGKRWWRLRPLYSRECWDVPGRQAPQPRPSPDHALLARSQPGDPYRGLVLHDTTDQEERVVGPRAEEIEVVLPAPATPEPAPPTLFPEEVTP